MSITRYDLDANADGYFDDPFMKVREQGKFILHSAYSALLARHNALVEAVKWERECEELHGIITELYCNVAESAPEEDEISMTYFAASAEVDRLLQEEK